MAGVVSAPRRAVDDDDMGDGDPGLPAPAIAALTEKARQDAFGRYAVLQPHLCDGVSLTTLSDASGLPLRTLERWVQRYRRAGLAGLARPPRADAGRRRIRPELHVLIEGLALRRPAPTAANVHRHIADVARRECWAIPSYSTVKAVIRSLDPALVTLAHEGSKRYREVFDLVHRRQADGPNEIWQADHTELDLWILEGDGKPKRPWLTVIEDDYSRAVCGYAVNVTAPSAMNTALALRQAIWRKTDPAWHVCGIPGVFYTDHGSDFTSHHLEQVAADLGVRLEFSLPGQPRGRGKIERLFDTVNQMCLANLPGYAPRGTPERADRAAMSLGQLDAELRRFLTVEYNHRVHGEIKQPPQARWEAHGFLPRLADSLEQLDLLLLTVAGPRKIHPDGVHFQGLRYLDPTLAALRRRTSRDPLRPARSGGNPRLRRAEVHRPSDLPRPGGHHRHAQGDHRGTAHPPPRPDPHPRRSVPHC